MWPRSVEGEPDIKGDEGALPCDGDGVILPGEHVGGDIIHPQRNKIVTKYSFRLKKLAFVVTLKECCAGYFLWTVWLKMMWQGQGAEVKVMTMGHLLITITELYPDCLETPDQPGTRG